MKLFERQDQRFVEQAVDDAKREEAIADLINRRRHLFWALVATLFGLLIVWFVGRNAVSAGGFGIAAIMNICIAMKLESDLCLLMIIKRLETK